MIKLAFIPILALLLSPPTQEGLVNYYLNENDFLSDHAVPVSETINNSFIKAEYDSLKRLISKSRYNDLGQFENMEKYNYGLSSENIVLKQYFNNFNELIKSTIFGKEGKSLSYIEYVFGVDSVIKWDDRFTTSTLNKDEKPQDFRFFDVNAFEYGGMEFDYDSAGNKTREEWLRRPDNKSMHKYLYNYYPGLNFTHILEYDSNGVLINDLKLSSDGTESILWLSNPSDSANINNSNLNYRLEGGLQWGRFMWVPVSGEDTLILDLKSLNRGEHFIAFDPDTILKDSLKYDVIFNGFTMNENPATERHLKNLTFDLSPPLINLNVDSYINTPEFKYNSSEVLQQAYLIWDIMDEDAAPDTVLFLESELNKFNTEKLKLKNQHSLQDAVYYSVKLIGIDLAGNQSIPVQNDSILYDISGPRFTITNLTSGDWINNQEIIFRPDETIKNWNLNLIWTGGLEDDSAPYDINVIDTISSGILDTNDLFNEFQLNDGSTYKFNLHGYDLAGNISEITTLDSIHYDITAPELTMIFPFNESIIKDVSVSYAVSEKLLAGEFRWEHTDGSVDTLAPHIVELIDQELSAKEKIHINLINEPLISDGAYYTIILSGRDLAGNQSEQVVVKNVLYDSSPPVFTKLGPDSGSAVNNLNISYEISENLKKGRIIWIPKGNSLENGIVNSQELEESELLQGEHFNLELINAPELQDGTYYDIIFVGSDFAGNQADTVKLLNILYDFTAPEISLQFPRADFVASTEKISYILSENLESGSFKWIWTGGNPDTTASRILYLTSQELSAGEHKDIQFLEFPELVENAEYSLEFTGLDYAHNSAFQIEPITALQYDFTAPVITWQYPQNNNAENDIKTGYTISEPLASGNITWKWIGGVKDTLSVRTADLSGLELNFDHSPDILINNPELVDGAVYDLIISGLDFAGNPSQIAQIHEVLYDFSAPELTVLYPLPRSLSKSNLMTYNLSEDLFEGIMKWVWLGGSRDTLAPHVVHLNKNESSKGIHEQQLLEETPKLVENSLYTFMASGQDIAGNKLKRLIIPGLRYDYSAPVFTWNSPADSTAQNHKRMQYGISELLDSGFITWTRVGGSPDPVQEHRLELKGEELSGQQHAEKLLKNDIELVSGTLYDIKLTGTDLAGNITDTLVARNVEYDIIAPLISIEYPASDIYTRETHIQYNLDENLVDGEIVWEPVSPQANISAISFKFSLQAGLKGQHLSDDYFIPDLQDGSAYQIKITGRDKAGNISEPVVINNYKFDRTPPVFSDLMPANGSFINELDLNWTVSEDIDSGAIIIKNLITDELDIIPLPSKNLARGKHNIKELQNFILKDGELYNFSLSGKDFAGNSADTVSINNITYDISAPQISITKPESGQHLIISDINYSTDELLSRAEIIWIEKNEQNLSYKLNDSDLESGSHLLREYWEEPAENKPFSIFIKGTDRAGNESISDTVENLMFDSVKPELAILFPVSASAINHSNLSVDISEDLSRAEVLWEIMEGIDGDAPYLIELLREDLQAGKNSNLTFSKIPALKDGITYKLTFTGMDLAGNEALPASVNNILYDITAPEFTQLSPEDSSFIKEVNLSYMLSENLQEGSIIFENVNENEQPGVSQTIQLAGKRKNQGLGGGLLPAAIVQLESGLKYNIKFTGIDRAGNRAPETIISNITFDNEKPTLDIMEPLPNSFVNSTSISYFISEELVEAVFMLESTAESGKLISAVDLSITEMQPGDHINTVLKGMVGWQDGGQYNLTLKGLDKAGNISETALVQAITLDQSKPVIKINKPSNGSYINYETLSYTLSENLAQGSLKFIQMPEDIPDPTVQNIELIDLELNGGIKENVKLVQGPDLVNGQNYKIVMNAVDRAGNEAEPFVVDEFHYDNEAPEISISLPIDGEQIQNTNISYIVSDDLNQAEAVLVQTGGTIDPSSPHRVKLTGKQLVKGMHADVPLNLEEKLADGGRYSFTIEAADRALNPAKTSLIQDVLFDILPPQVYIDYPTAGLHLNQMTLNYGTSEEMSRGEFIFTRIGGNEDLNSPHIYNLTGDNLKQGAHAKLNIDLLFEDGSIYKLQFIATDLAGNIADTLTVLNIYYDTTAPILTVNSPVSDSFHKSIDISFMNNENLSSGEIFLTRRAGTNDLGSPHNILFTQEQLQSGKDLTLILNQKLKLVSGSIYNINIKVIDLAGNQSSELEIFNVKLDNTAPVLSIINPLSESYVNNYIAELFTDEKLQTGTVLWEWAGGIEDKTGKHEFDISGDLFQAGNYSTENLPEYPALVNGASYKIYFSGSDLAQNSSLSEPVLIHYDNEKPVISDFLPVSDTYINNLNVNYVLSEPLKTGSLHWKQSDNSLKIDLTGKEILPEGPINSVLINQTELVDGLSYNIIFQGTDRAGNKQDSILSESVVYDISKPKFTNVKPGTGNRINSPHIFWDINENIASGSYSWIHMGGQEDPNAPHKIIFEQEMLKAGNHDNVSLADPELVADAMYRITLEAVDYAGNMGKKLMMSIVYDDLPPTLKINYPESNSSVTNLNIAYEISERLSSGQFIYTRTGGEPDANSPVIVDLTGFELEKNYETPVNPVNTPQLKDGTVYNITFKGFDLALNESESPVIENVKFDLTRPVITITKPQENHYYFGTEMTIDISEDLKDGKMVWTRTGGVPDRVSMHKIPLYDIYLKEGFYPAAELPIGKTLSAGVIYSLSVEAQDYAGNQAEPVNIEGIKYIRSMAGSWYYQGAIIEVVWKFTPDPGKNSLTGQFMQGLSLGTKISDQETGRYTLDYDSKIWTITMEMDTPGKNRISIFEFIAKDRIKVITGVKKPKSWYDGEVMEYEWRP